MILSLSLSIRAWSKYEIAQVSHFHNCLNFFLTGICAFLVSSFLFFNFFAFGVKKMQSFVTLYSKNQSECKAGKGIESLSLIGRTKYQTFWSSLCIFFVANQTRRSNISYIPLLIAWLRAFFPQESTLSKFSFCHSYIPKGLLPPAILNVLLTKGVISFHHETKRLYLKAHRRSFLSS